MFQEGDCDFIVRSVFDRSKDGGPLMSKNGRKMVKVGLIVRDVNGCKEEIFDYFLDEYPKKKEDFLKTIGAQDPFGVVDNRFLNAKGRCTTVWKEYNGNDYLNVKKYLKPARTKKAPEPVKENIPQFDDEIPF